ncbi:MAG: pyridoxamine 5'-phosphate oxidase family protein [Phycisphaerae bacterium]
MADASDKGRYHPRRMEKEITDLATMLAIIRGQKILTLAMCLDGRPYLVTMDYGFSEAEDCFYFHCALEGKKIDILRANPNVWGQVLEDRGYLVGKCSHAYRTVMFEGVAEMVEDADTKKQALELMIQQLEPDPAPLMSKLDAKAIAGTGIIRIRVTAMSAKQSPAPKK